MRFGVREICDVVFKAKADIKIGTQDFKQGQPVLYIDTAKTSSIENAATTVYATGGRGNTRLIAWEGEKTVTFTVEDALLSPIGFAVLSGAGLFKNSSSEPVYVHTTARAQVSSTGVISLAEALETGEQIDDTAPIFVMVTDTDGSFTGELLTGLSVDTSSKQTLTGATAAANKTVFVDFYVKKTSAVTELQIDASNFGGYYYVEASTLFRRESDGVDLPAEITFPNVKIQSNFTFSMASTGDPSTFTFTMDAFPGYTMFDKTKKVICVMQVIEPGADTADTLKSVMGATEGQDIEESKDDSTTSVTD